MADKKLQTRYARYQHVLFNEVKGVGLFDLMHHITIMYAQSYCIDVRAVLVFCSFLVPYYLAQQYIVIKDYNDIEME